MAREAGYPLKSPRGRPHNVVARVFDTIEDAIYIIVAALLVIAGIFVLGNAVGTLIHDISTSSSTSLTTLVIDVLDNGLLLFIIAELLHTVRATIQQRALVVEPFLIVGLIAGVRRLLVLTAQYAAQSTNSRSGPPADQFTWAHQGIELTVLLGLILGMTVALVLYHRYHGPGAPDDEG